MVSTDEIFATVVAKEAVSGHVVLDALADSALPCARKRSVPCRIWCLVPLWALAPAVETVEVKTSFGWIVHVRSLEVPCDPGSRTGLWPLFFSSQPFSGPPRQSRLHPGCNFQDASFGT
jgi:hypothetical protein